MSQELLIGLCVITSLIAAFALFRAHKATTTQDNLTSELGEIRDKMSEIIWDEKLPYVRYSYSFNKAREHQFDIEVINVLDEPITIQDLLIYPQDKLSYSEVAFPLEKNVRPERISYNDKITLERAKAPVDVELGTNQRYVLRYNLKFKDAVFTGRKPRIFMSYQSIKHPESREIRIPEMENFGIKPLQMRTPQQSRVSH